MTRLLVENLHVSHRQHTVLRNINLRVQQGQLVAIVGPNGCGKSTLLRSIARLHKPSKGSIHIDGGNVWTLRPSSAAKRLAFLPQSPQAPQGITARTLAQHGRHPHQGLFRQWSAFDEQIVDEALAATGVSAFCDTPLEELSGGQRQRCWLAMALAQDTPLLLLDEPTSMLDLGHQVEVLDQIKHLTRTGHSIVIVLHDLSLAARYADLLVAMNQGEIVATGKPSDIVTPQLVQQLYGIEAEVFYGPNQKTPTVAPAVTL